MSWLQKRPQVSNPIPYYTIGQNKTFLLVGLGNPGKEYDLTRHNVGFLVLDAFVNNTPQMDPWINKKDFKCHLSSGQLGEVRIIAIKPTTFMNLSGEAVQAVARFYKLTINNITVIHDDLDINFGQIRIRTGGSSAGHNGIKSISQHLGDNYNRIRIGIGPKKPPTIDSADFVLQKFNPEEQAQFNNLTREINSIINEYVFGSNNLNTETRSFLI